MSRVLECRGHLLVALVVVVLSIAGCSDDDTAGPDTTTTSSTTGSTSTSTENGDAEQPTPADDAIIGDIPELVRSIEPSVVSIEVSTRAGRGAGSGVVVREDGVIVTNAHVVAGAQDVVVVLADGSRLDGTVAAVDRFTDLALVRVDRDGLPEVPIADGYPTVGEPVVAVGNPLGFENTVTSGIVSGIQRSIPAPASQGGQALVDLIQTDAAISPGNSGGALVDFSGELIGINVAYLPPASGAVSLGFAIPAPTVSDVVTELLADGEVDHPYLGVRLGTVTPEIADRLGTDVEAGAAVLGVEPATPAARAGLESGDIIVEIAGEEIRKVGDVLTQMRRLEPGDEVDLVVQRGDQQETLTVELGARPTT